MIPESAIALLIPTYKSINTIGRCIESALATGAGEIIVSDNASDDGTVELLAEVRDPRFRCIVQHRNIGLWENHLALIRQASMPWIKFLHADDWLAPGGLAIFAESASSETALVGALPIYVDLATGESRQVFRLERPLRFSSEEYMRRLLVVGNELGTPSTVLFNRARLLSRGSAYWISDLSADLIANVATASQGEVVLLPAGPVFAGEHRNRDSFTQGPHLAVKRTYKTIEYLLDADAASVRRMGVVFGGTEALGAIRLLIGEVRRGRWVSGETWGLVFRTLAGIGLWGLAREAGSIGKMLGWKYGRRNGRDIAKINRT